MRDVSFVVGRVNASWMLKFMK